MRHLTETNRSSLGTLLLVLLFAGCGPSAEERILQELTGHGGPGGDENADASRDSGGADDAETSSDASAPTEAGLTVDAGDLDATDRDAPSCASGSVPCGEMCCNTELLKCVTSAAGEACVPICDHASPLCNGVCCEHGSLCIQGVCLTCANVPLCNGGTVCCPAGETCGDGDTCVPASDE